ncbi:hypothetical protein [Roseibium sp. MMSF_3412]|uniref:hypothetical protein n=1 Tax=Roseibium sp. MMSF_3412 TaxID=3046712 RepID=UPI00273ECE7A|nr:hypothetical protein [Roseibium sp. MMSF_3412]
MKDLKKGAVPAFNCRYADDRLPQGSRPVPDIRALFSNARQFDHEPIRTSSDVC